MITKPSDEFIQAFCHTGSCCILCELCGTTIFTTWDEGCFDSMEEIEDLKKKAKEQPLKYQEMSNVSSICFGVIDGKQCVPDHSDKCDEKIAKHEQWILNHRYIIADYLNARAKSIVDSAKLDAEMTKVKNVV